jgi:hypothetical protein
LSRRFLHDHTNPGLSCSTDLPFTSLAKRPQAYYSVVKERANQKVHGKSMPDARDQTQDNHGAHSRRRLGLAMMS